MRHLFLSLLSGAVVTLSLEAAALVITTYEKRRSESASSQARALLEIYLLGVGEGFKWANAALPKQKQSMLFCAPERIGLNADNYVQVIDEALALNREAYIKMELPVEAILLYGLQQKLPCSAK